MSEQARAAVLTAPRTFEVQEFALPSIGAEDGLLRIEACGICASDLPVWRGESDFELPVILGHEIVGRIERLGASAARRWGVQEGDRIVVERWVPCGHCELCYSGNYRQCVPVVDGHRRFYGGAPTTLQPSLWGGYATHLYLDRDAVVYPVSGDVSAHVVPFFTPLANAIDWLGRVGGAGVGSTVVIQGPGQEGLAATIAAAAAGASQVIVLGLERDTARLQSALSLGATTVINIERDDAVEVVNQVTGGKMADVILDVTSTKSNAPLATSIQLLGRGGTIVAPSFHPDNSTPLDLDRLIHNAGTIRTVWGRDRAAIGAALRLLESGRVPMSVLGADEFSLEELGSAFEIQAGERAATSGAMHMSVIP